MAIIIYAQKRLRERKMLVLRFGSFFTTKFFRKKIKIVVIIT